MTPRRLLQLAQQGPAASGNPLWLTLALEQLNLLDADDFRRPLPARPPAPP